WAPALGTGVVLVLHGVIAVAALKLLCAEVQLFVLKGSPRRHRRGRIEANTKRPCGSSFSSSPRRHRRGRIEARLACVACLKEFKSSPRRHRRGRIEAEAPAEQFTSTPLFSTASSPWPH